MAEIVNPIHPEMIQKLDPEFVAYYNANSADKLGPHQIPWSPSIRETKLSTCPFCTFSAEGH